MIRHSLKFKGGPVALNSGGQGPDDFMLKPVQGGRWTLVIFRWGRNWQGRKVGLETARCEAEADKEAMKKIFPVQQVCVPDNARRYRRMRDRGIVPTLSATEFWEKYGQGKL